MNMLVHRHQKITIPKSKQENIRHFLSENQTGVLATVGLDGTPHASVIYYTLDHEFNVRFITKEKTQKSYDLKHDGRATLIVYDEATQTTAQISGVASKVNDEAESSQAFRNGLRASLHTAESAIPPISKLAAGNYVAYKLESAEVRMAVFNMRSSQQPENMFQVLQGNEIRY